MVASMGDSPEKSTECVWKEDGFFWDQRADLTINKANFPENTLVYVNNGSVTLVKGGQVIHLEYTILAQILPVANSQPPEVDLDNHKYLDNEVLIFTPLYNTENGLYRSLKKRLGNIIWEVIWMKLFFVVVLTRKCQKFFIVLKSNHYQTYLNALLLKSTFNIY